MHNVCGYFKFLIFTLHVEKNTSLCIRYTCNWIWTSFCIQYTCHWIWTSFYIRYACHWISFCIRYTCHWIWNTSLVNLLTVVCNLYLSLLSTTAEMVVCSTRCMVLFSVEVRVIPIEGMVRQVVRPKRCISKKTAVCIEEPFTPPCCFCVS